MSILTELYIKNHPWTQNIYKYENIEKIMLNTWLLILQYYYYTACFSALFVILQVLILALCSLTCPDQICDIFVHS